MTPKTMMRMLLKVGRWNVSVPKAMPTRRTEAGAAAYEVLASRLFMKVIREV